MSDRLWEPSAERIARANVTAFAEQIAPVFGLTPRAALDVPIALVGTIDQICADLVERRETFGFSYIVVHDLDGLAPVVARLAGT